MELSERQKLEIKNAPMRYKIGLEKLYRGELGLRKSVNLKCVSCVGYENVKIQVGECTCKICPLWHKRPYQRKMNNNE